MDNALPNRIETERLYLRPYRAGDGSMYYSVSQRNRAHLARYEAQNVVMSINSEEEAETTVRQLAAAWEAHDCFFMGVWEKASDRFVAQIYVGWVSRDLPELAIGYFVDVEHEGIGYVTEAVKGALKFVFDDLGAHRVRLECDDANVRSYRVAERCGFVREGHLRETKQHADGAYSGTLYYGLLRREYEALASTSCA